MWEILEKQSLLLFGEIARWRSSALGGVLMIDEVENSLHPTLQRLVMWNLKTLAREWDVQVIVATHSLEIIQTVRGGAFINLDYPEDQTSHSNRNIIRQTRTGMPARLYRPFRAVSRYASIAATASSGMV